MNTLKAFFISSLASCYLIACQTTPDFALNYPVEDWQAIQGRILKGHISTNDFQKLGPFPYNVFEDYEIPVSPQKKVITDLVLSDHASLAPLVIFVHGNKFNKRVHRKQAIRFASWGFHSLAVGVPNQGQWLENGKTVDMLVRLIHNYPSILSDKINREQIILAGHSFGGSAVTIAAGRKAPAAGLLLLDPAVVHPKVKTFMRKVKIPALLLGADPNVFRARKRYLFYKNIAGPMIEVTVTGATHNDAQYPSINSVYWGFDPYTDQQKQEEFLTAMLVGAFSISANDNLLFAWNHFKPRMRKGFIKQAKGRKQLRY